MEEEAYQELEDAIRNEFISYEAIEELVLRTVIDKSKVLENKKGFMRWLDYIDNMKHVNICFI